MKILLLIAALALCGCNRESKVDSSQQERMDIRKEAFECGYWAASYSWSLYAIQHDELPPHTWLSEDCARRWADLEKKLRVH